MMTRTTLLLNAAMLLAVCAWEVPEVYGQKPSPNVAVSALWRDRGDPASLDLTFGSGGRANQPVGPFTFVKEDKEGTAPKFEIVDGLGVRWKAKLGEEAKAETAAAGLLAAVGYFTDDDYYLSELRVAKLPKLARGREFVTADGIVHGVRLERTIPGQKKAGNWDWFKNSFIGTKEMNGLKVMMALVNNWDLKELNNAIYRSGAETRYVVSDLGASFGQTGNTLVRSKSNLDEYREAAFTQKVGSEEVDFVLSSRPLVPLAVNVPYYVTRTKMQGIVKDIPITHAKWVGQLLGRLAPAQIRDCFRAAGYAPEEVEGFAVAVEGRIAELNNL